ncbi:MAG: hypothetical protein H7Y31_01910, partial [Chitinophagaceae bacterium]|nr:hypothetical protein [Chitinophagaceae bacterium]
MRKLYISLLLLLFYCCCFSQKNLSGSRHNSFYTYVYKINHREAAILFNSNMKRFDETHLHKLVDSFLSDEGMTKILSPGNYLYVHAVDNVLKANFKVVDDLDYKLIVNDRDLMIALHTMHGKLIADADVTVARRTLKYQPSIQSYRLAKYSKAGVVRVLHNDVVHFFPIANPGKKKFAKLWQRLQHGFPIRQIQRFIRKMRDRDDYRYYSYFDGESEHERKFTGFMVFSKPIYKPGDTVRLKAFINDRKGNPVRQQLLVRLTDRELVTDTILSILSPYRPGGYEYHFVVTDSLDLGLDQKHMISLEAIESARYTLDAYDEIDDDNLEEDEYLLRRKILMRGKFEYEEYELHTVNFFARTDQSVHHRGDIASLFLKATDENEMPIMDGRIKIDILHSASLDEYTSRDLFIPDTLWHHEQTLEAIGETKIALPDSIFPNATIDYRIQCTFLNSNNELREKTLRQHFDSSRFQITINKANDSLYLKAKNGNESIRANAAVFAFVSGGIVAYKDSVELPAVIPFNPYYASYRVQSQSAATEYQGKKERSDINCSSQRTKDSVRILIKRNDKMPFWYSIFEGNQIIDKGYSQEVLFEKRIKSKATYFVSVQYVHANVMHKEEFHVPYTSRLLTIGSTMPSVISPGDIVNVTVTVTDDDNRPVNHADLTAYAFTKKFENAFSPAVPYYGMNARSRKKSARFVKVGSADPSGSLRYSWEKWSRELGLDTIEYFKFLHPQSIYTNHEPAIDSITQIAPFVVLNGVLQPVHHIYIDEEPIFFKQSQDLQRYSFQVQP